MTDYGKPLNGIRVLALEQMQAMPSATLMLARLGAEVVKVEWPQDGESGRSSLPAITTPDGAKVGATFLRYGLGKKSITIDIKTPEGRDLIHRLAPSFDVICENLGPGRAAKYGVDHAAIAAVSPRTVYLSISGFGVEGNSPYGTWPAYAGVAEAMSGGYEFTRRPNQAPVINPLGGVGDTGAGMFGVIGVLAALMQREKTGKGQFVDIAMADSVLSICDFVGQYWSMGLRREPDAPLRMPQLMSGFRAADGWFFMQIARQHQFDRLARLLERTGWLQDARFATSWGWTDHLEDEIRPAVEAWAKNLTKIEACSRLAGGGIVAGPCFSGQDIVQDPHFRNRHMLVEIPRTDGVAQPVVVVGNPVKMSDLPDTIEPVFPRLGEDTGAILKALAAVKDEELAELRRRGII
jgi:crotonobetainyl-CoA:carnitine CoA-transferase CaiB-like acyl-CoA transferase